jgi:hypothetical protein
VLGSSRAGSDFGSVLLHWISSEAAGADRTGDILCVDGDHLTLAGFCTAAVGSRELALWR